MPCMYERNGCKEKKTMKHTIKLPLDHKKKLIFYTRDIFSEEEFINLEVFLRSIDWDAEKWICLPSEYIIKVEIVDK